MAHVHNNNNNNNNNDSNLISIDNEQLITNVAAGEEEVLDTTITSPIAIVTPPISTTEATGPTVAGNAVSFSPLPMGRSFAESYPTRRFHEFGSSPAQSLVQVLETAGATGVGSQDDQWVADASVATGTSGVHFQPQRGGQFAHSHFRRTSGSGAWMATSMPESRFSEFEVVYDDGIRKQRTFSLTTELDEDERSSSDNDEGSEHSPLLEYHEAGSSDHDSSHLPDDAIHTHLGYPGRMQGGSGTTPPTFPSSIPSTHNHSTTPLLNKQHPYYSSSAGVGARLYSQQSKRRSKPAEYLGRVSQTVWSYVSGDAIPLPTRRILKASLAYLFACLVSFTPFFLPYIGMSGHLAASSAVFFNPAKSLGRMVDAVTAGLSAIAFGVLVSVASMLSAIWFNSRDLYIWGHVVSVVVFGGGSTFIIAYAKAYFNRPTVNVACTLSHIMILVTLTKEGALSLGDFNMTRVLAVTTSMLLGVAISTLISIFLWPESAHEKLRQDMGKSLTSFRLLLKLLTKTFLLESDTTPFGSESVQRLIETQVKSFSALAKSLEEAQLEFPGADIKKYEACVKSLNTLAQYLNGLRSSCGLQYDMLKKDEHLKDSAPKPQPLSTTSEAGLNGAGVGAGANSGSGGRKALGFGMRMSSFSLIGSMGQDQEQSASADLIEFLEHVGKPMKSLALTCKLTIEHLQDIFTSTDGDKKATLGRSNSRTRVSQLHAARQSGYESGEIFSDSTLDIGASNTHPSVSTDTFKKSPSLMLMQINLAKALDIFEKANSKALKRFYSHQNKRRSGHIKRPFGMSRPMSEPAFHDLGFGVHGPGSDAHGQQDALTEKAPVGEQIFLVYFFVFNLMEFSKELTHLVSCVEELVDGDEGLPMWIERNRQPWWRRIWFSLTGFPRRLRRPIMRRQAFEDFDDPEPGNRPPASRYSHPHSTSQNHTPNHSNNASSQGSRQRKQRLFPKPNMHNKTDTLHTPRPSTFLQKWSTRLWKFLHVFRSFQVKYAAKAALSAMILLIPAFVDWTRPYFVQYRGEWALISMLIVMVPTVGGTNIVGIYRLMGTIVGCYAGVAIYLLFPANDILLPICCFLFAVPNFYLVLCSAYPRIGQVTLLAFNLVLIQTYNRRHGDGTVPPDDEDDDEMGGPATPTKMIHAFGSLLGDTSPNDPNHVSYVWTIAFHRAVAVSLGVVIGVGVTSYVWPYEARVELRKGLSDLLLNISWLYNRLVSVYSTNLDKVSVVPPQKPYRGPRERVQEILRRTTFQERFQAPVDGHEELPDDPTESDMDRMNKEFMAIELSLQLQLLRLYALLEETPNEPRLKGKFPVRTYKNMLGSCQNILDRFLSMRLVITKDEWIESARRDFIVPVNKERREMVGNVLLYFYTIASALRLKTPLPPYLPPANNARLRLIQKIRQLPVVQNKVVMTEDNDERYVFYYAYALVMDDVIRELERLGRWSQDLFGVITSAIEFEAWFTDDGAPSTQSWPSAELPSSATREAPLSPLHDIDQPFEYPDRPQATTPSASGMQDQQQQRSIVQRPLSNPARYRQRANEASILMDTESQTHSQDLQDRDGLFDFDPQDPFRDIYNSPVAGGGSSPFQRGERRFNSSQSLNDAISQQEQQPYHDKSFKSRRQGSHASRSSQGSRQQYQFPSQRSYGSTTPQLPRNSVGTQPQQRAASLGGSNGHSGTGRASSMKKSSSGSFGSYNRAATSASIATGEGSGQNSRPLSISGSSKRLPAAAATRNQEQE